MTAEDDLKNLNQVIEQLAEEQRAADEKERLFNLQIQALRHEIAKLKDSRFEVTKKIRAATFDKESLERKFELEKEAELIQKSIDARMAEVEEIIADAPWKDVAFKWQIEGAVKLPERALLGDKRGLGKTLSAIIWRRVQKAKKTLICVRAEVASDFIKELNLREPNLFVYNLVRATPTARQIAAMLLSTQEEFVVITNIESWRRNIDQTVNDLMRIKYDAVILDEAHHIKNLGTGTAQGFLKLAYQIPKVLELTGTPIKNRPQEMFTLLHALYPHLFPKESKYLADYCIQISQNKWTFTAMGLKSLVAKISSFYTARSPEDVGRLIPPPQIVEYKLNFENHEEQKKAYQVMTERSMAILGSGTVIPIVSQLAIMTRQAQVVSWPAGIVFNNKDEEGEIVETIKFDVHQSVKMDWAEDLVQELVEEGKRVIMFSRFKPAIYELRDRLEAAGLSVAVITGDEKAKGNTEEVFNDFDLKTAHPTDYKYQVLLATYQTVGESANLNAASHMILYDRFWNPGNEDQAIGRIDRINSTKQATIHVPLVDSSIDEYMTDLIEGKRNIVTEFKDAATMQSNLMDHLRKTVQQ